MANAFLEEAIFRIGIVSPLYGLLTVPVIVLISGMGDHPFCAGCGYHYFDDFDE
jgi:hypothetical protein